MTKEVLTLALEALKLSDTVFYPQTKIAIAAIERALANHIEDNLAMVAQPTPAEYAMGYAEGFNDGCKPKPEQEPVAFINVEKRSLEWVKPISWHTPTTVNLPNIPLYTTPPQRTWVGLTDEEVNEIYTSVEAEVNEHWNKGGTTMMFPLTLYKAIEAKLRSKNI
jgi:hypothetical protein